jgi:hypothetical protein
MIMRRRPLLRAAVVGGGAYAMGRRSAQRDAEPEQEQEPQQSAPAPDPPDTAAAPSMSDQLSQLTALHQQGALTDAEFASAKAKLLGS